MICNRSFVAYGTIDVAKLEREGFQLVAIDARCSGIGERVDFAHAIRP